MTFAASYLNILTNLHKTHDNVVVVTTSKNPNSKQKNFEASEKTHTRKIAYVQLIENAIRCIYKPCRGFFSIIVAVLDAFKMH